MNLPNARCNDNFFLYQFVMYIIERISCPLLSKISEVRSYSAQHFACIQYFTETQLWISVIRRCTDAWIWRATCIILQVLTGYLGFTLLLVTRFTELCSDWWVFGVCPCFEFAGQPLVIYSEVRISEDFACWQDTGASENELL